MTALDDEDVAVQLACETQDRATSEQRALLRLAMRVESERNKATSRNLAAWGNEPACTLVDLVEQTHDPHDGDPVTLSAADRTKVERRRARWEQDRADFAAGRPFR